MLGVDKFMVTTTLASTPCHQSQHSPVFYDKILDSYPFFLYLCMVKRSYKKWQKIRIQKITIQPLIFKY